jgi:hypothetical protein
VDNPPVGAAAGAAAAAVSHIPQSLKKNFSLIALMHQHHCTTAPLHHCTTASLHHLHHQHHCTTYPLKKNFSQKTHNNTQPH